jgi:molybdopterin converting factor subunit 1
MSASAIPAIVPAAGKSRRMGRPKPLLPFDGKPLIARVVSALGEGGADPVLVVVPPASKAEGPAIAEAAREAGASVIVPEKRPLEMRESVDLAIAWLRERTPPAAVMVAPADSAGLTAEIVRHVLDCWGEHPDAIIVPVASGKRAHPLVLPWDLALFSPTLGIHQGINAIVAENPGRVVELAVPYPELAEHLNTPEDLSRWQARMKATVIVRLFAVAKQRAGKAQVEVELALPSTVAIFRRALAQQHPELAELAPTVMIAVDSEYAADEIPIRTGSSVALIPPVSGGSTC